MKLRAAIAMLLMLWLSLLCRGDEDNVPPENDIWPRYAELRARAEKQVNWQAADWDTAFINQPGPVQPVSPGAVLS